MIQDFELTRVVGESAYPGIEVEETFTGTVNLPEDNDTEPELISVKRNGVEMHTAPLFNSPSQAWKQLYAICFEAARDAQWREHCKKERA